MALALALTPSSVTVGQTFQAAVTGAAPGEVITFTYDAVAPQSVTADGLGNASVTFTATTSGTVVAAGATSGAATATVTVGAAQGCAVSVTSSPARPAAGQPVTVTATVTCGGSPVPGATVLFSTTSGPLGVGLTNASGQAGVTTSTLPAGSTTVTATVLTATGSTCNCAGSSGTGTVTVGGATGLTAHPACYTLNVPPLPWAFATATFTASGATPGATVTFHLDGPAGPVVCTAVANASGNASCTATLNVGQVLFSGYTATSGGASSSSTLSVCLT
ncbi:hypothetical protein OHS81_25360 [Streptomyces sp. NBC_00400]|uniref:hypothetical protein n=1 Tax=Streptomyces sp. NBC_00400 TaxID=2975737 RepID=UPI002E23D9EF